MISSSNLLSYVKQGLDLRVTKSENSRVIEFINGRGKLAEVYRLGVDEYESLIEEFIEDLVQRDGSSISVDFISDDNGRPCLQVESGLLRHRKSRLSLSPKHMTWFEYRLAQCHLQRAS